MKKNLDLFNLIGSLNKGEKIYLSRILPKGNSTDLYVKIFHQIKNIPAAEAYDETDIMNRLSVKSKNNFAVAKNYLYDLILKTLAAYYSENSSDNILKQQLAYIELLYKKTFFSKAYELLKKARKKAYATDNFTRLLEIIKWERNLVIEGIVKGDKPVNIKRLFDEESDILAKIKNVSEYRLLGYRLRDIMVGYSPNSVKKYMPALKEFRKEPLLSNEKNALSFAAQAAFYFTHSLISQYVGENEKGYRNRKKLSELMESRSEILRENPLNYIISIYNLMESCFVMRYYEEMKGLIKKLTLFGDKTQLPANAEILLRFACLKEKLKMLAAKGEYAMTHEPMTNLLSLLENEKGKLSQSDEIESYYIAANVLFSKGEYLECPVMINKILSLNYITGTEGIVINTKILNIIIHYELKNIDLVYYLIKSLYKFLKQDHTNDSLNRILLKFLSMLIKVSNDAELSDVVSEFHEKLLMQYKDDVITFNSLENWIKMKISSK